MVVKPSRQVAGHVSSGSKTAGEPSSLLRLLTKESAIPLPGSAIRRWHSCGRRRLRARSKGVLGVGDLYANTVSVSVAGILTKGQSVGSRASLGPDGSGRRSVRDRIVVRAPPP